jgi:hypothetical protein
MVGRRSKPCAWFAAALLCLSWCGAGHTEPALDSLKEIFTRLHSCWKPPPLALANPIDITVVVSFNREGVILGHPRISYESEQAGDGDRLQYRLAVMETLQRCTPLPFTEGLGGAVAGRPLAIPFRTRKRQPKPEEKRAWLIQKIL